MKLTKVLCASALAITMLMGGGTVADTLGCPDVFSSLSITAHADEDNDAAAARDLLRDYILCTGDYADEDISGKRYKLEGGGYVTYADLVDSDKESTGYIDGNQFDKLKGNEKSKFLGDANNQANKAMDDASGIVYDDTKNDWLQRVQNLDGVGSQLMSTLLQNTKPDYATANRIYEPFSGVVGTVIALGAILIMAALGIVMVLDLSYIGIPIFRNAVEGEGSGGQNSKPKWISYEATSAVQQAEGSGGNGGQDGGSKKTAVGIYFKKRVIMLVILGVCLLYLVQGQIFNLVAWILDLLSGFLGF